MVANRVYVWPIRSTDHDGDVLGTHFLFSEEANAEIDEMFNKPISMVDASHSLVYGLGSGRLCRFGMFAVTYHPLPNQ